MKQKLEYMVASGDDSTDKFGFMAQVAAALTDDWIPLGGVQVTRQTNSTGGSWNWHYQAMIRRTHTPWWRFWK